MVVHRFEPLSGKVLGAALHVHRSLGAGFLEGVYERALVVALSTRGLSIETQKEVRIRYAGIEVGRHRLDLLVEGRVIVEIKAVEHLQPIHLAQVRSYLRATDLQIGLLLNFNSPTLQVRRVVNRADT